MSKLVQEILEKEKGEQPNSQQQEQAAAAVLGAGVDMGGVGVATARSEGTAPPPQQAPVVLEAGAVGVHFNSQGSRPARALKGKKSGAADVMGAAPPGAKNVLVWLRQV